jgi:hypothetical protein
MGVIRPARKVKLICGMISADVDLMRRSRTLLARQFGDVDDESDVWLFDATDYYEAEMGTDLKRMFVSFARLIDPGQIARIKRETNELEAQICRDCAAPPEFRLVNLDPGYVGIGKLVLATTKDYSHRIYVADGIYAEVTLHWHENRWEAWPWTYPDYASDRYHAFFTRVRNRLREQISTLPSPETPREMPDP